MTRTALAWTVVLLAVAWLPAATQDRQVLFEKALALEEAQGKLQDALALYQKIVDESSGNQALAAQAQLHIGICYEKLGNAQARGAYERVIADFPEQASEVAAARARLAALTKGSQPATARPIFRRVHTPELSVPGSPQLSPDGRTLAFCSEGAIWVVPLAGEAGSGIPGVPVRLPGVERAQDPVAWSHDGRWLAYNRTPPGQTLASEMWVVSASGGPPRVVPFQPLRAGAPNFRISLSPDGRDLAFVHQASVLPPAGGIYIVPVEGGTPKSLTAAGAPSTSPVFSPDGRRIAFVRDDTNVWVADADGSTPAVQVSNVGTAQYPVWSPDGKMIAFVRWSGTGRSTQMCIVRVPDAGEVASTPTVTDLPQPAAVRLAGWTADNRIGVVVRPEEQVSLYTVPATGGISAQLTDGGRPMSPSWSPDGSRIVFLGARHGDAASEFGYVASLPSRGGQESRVPITMTKQFYAAWHLNLSRDGRLLAFSGSKFVGEKGPFGGYRLDIYAIPVGGGDLRQITSGGWDRNPSWSPDGKSVVFIRQQREPSGSDLKFGASLYTAQVDGGDPVLLASASNGSRPRWSPDGTLIAFLSDQRTLSVIPAKGGATRVVAPADSDSDLSWSPDGTEIAFVSGGRLRAVSPEGGTPRLVSTGLDAMPHDLSWSPDGSRIAFTASKGGDPELWFMEDFLHLVKSRR
jgi:Tol biopolymer transport system component